MIEIRYAPVLSPGLAASVGSVREPRDLSGVPILHQHDRGEWRAWLEIAGAADLELTEETVIEDSNVVIQAAINGQGVALGVFPFIQSEIDSGRLVKPFEIELVPRRAFFLLTRPGSRRTREVAAVCDWLLGEARADTAQD